MKQAKIKVGLDYDDVLALCNEYAIKKYNEATGKNFSVNDISSWNCQDETLEFRMRCFHDPNFVATQPLFPGAKNFIQKLSRKADVYITSAVFPECMSARALRIIKDFPQIKEDHIILGATKGLYNLDMMLDDGSHNVRTSQATYPVLLRRPWNTDLSGVLSVNTYDDFLHIVDLVCSSYTEGPDLSNGGVICLVGPSGSGKTAIMTDLTKDENFIKPVTTTTRVRRDDEPEDAYRFISEDEFLREMDKKSFLETTVYSGYHYGTSRKQIEDITDTGKYAVIPIDICGAIAIKNAYREKAILVFIDRKKETVINEIINRNVPTIEKTKRIMSLDKEYANENFCDYVVHNDGTIHGAARKVKTFLN